MLSTGEGVWYEQHHRGLAGNLNARHVRPEQRKKPHAPAALLRLAATPNTQTDSARIDISRLSSQSCARVIIFFSKSCCTPPRTIKDFKHSLSLVSLQPVLIGYYKYMFYNVIEKNIWFPVSVFNSSC